MTTAPHPSLPRPLLLLCEMQVFQASARVTDMVGLANGGISSDIAGRMHKMQGNCGKR
jgi:hypothetical protein